MAKQAQTSESESEEEEVEEEILEQHFELLDEEGEPVSGYHYDLCMDGSVYVKGRALMQGKTQRVSGSGNLSVVAWLMPREGGVRI